MTTMMTTDRRSVVIIVVSFVCKRASVNTLVPVALNCFTLKTSASAVPPCGVRGGAQFGSRSWQAAIGWVRSVDRSSLRIHVFRTVVDTVSNSYGSEGRFESLRVHRSYGAYERPLRRLTGRGVV